MRRLSVAVALWAAHRAVIDVISRFAQRSGYRRLPGQNRIGTQWRNLPVAGLRIKGVFPKAHEICEAGSSFKR
jgi:hypothetical protein